MDSIRHLPLEGQLLATAEVAETYGHDGDMWDSLFLFRADDGYTLVTLTRGATCSVTGAMERGVVDTAVDHPGDVRQLEELVSSRHGVSSEAWWRILEAGRHHAPELHAAWVRERVHRDLDRPGIRNRELASVIGALAVEPANEFGLSDGMGLG